MRRVEDVGVDEVELGVLVEWFERGKGAYLFLLLFKPYGVALLNVLHPEMLFFEELLTFGNAAPELVLIFLLDELLQVLLESFFGWHTTKLADISLIRLQDLHQLFFEGLDPVESALKLLLGFRSSAVSLKLSVALGRESTCIHLIAEISPSSPLSWKGLA